MHVGSGTRDSNSTRSLSPNLDASRSSRGISPRTRRVLESAATRTGIGSQQTVARIRRGLNAISDDFDVKAGPLPSKAARTWSRRCEDKRAGRILGEKTAREPEVLWPDPHLVEEERRQSSVIISISAGARQNDRHTTSRIADQGESKPGALKYRSANIRTACASAGPRLPSGSRRKSAYSRRS
jgi:hypothetical protein